MKTKLTFISLFFLAYAHNAIAQFDTVPNASFENWYLSSSALLPVSWQTSENLTSVVGVHSAVKDSTPADVCDGSYSLELISGTALSYYFPGVGTNGIIGGSIATPTYTGGSIDTARSGKLTGCFKYAPVANDTGSIIVILYKRNTSRDTIAIGSLKFTGTTSSLSPFEVPLVYRDFVNNPDSVFILVQSSPGIGNAQVGSTLIVDNLLLNGYVGINETPDNINSVNLYPSPVSTELNVKIEMKKSIQTSAEIFDATGNKVLTHVLQSNNDRIDVRSLSNGNYFIDLLDENHNKIYSGRFSVNR